MGQLQCRRLFHSGFRLPQCPGPPHRDRQRVGHFPAEGSGVQRYSVTISIPPFLLWMNDKLTCRLTDRLHPRYILPAARGGGHHRGRGGGRRVLLLRAGSLAPHAVVQRSLQPALAGLGGDGHQVPTGGLQHQWEQCRHNATSVRSPKTTHHLLSEGSFDLCVSVCECAFYRSSCASF